MKPNLAEENWQYYLGNHRQFYSGRTLPKDNPLYDTFNHELDRYFNSYNVCGEIVDHYSNALIGKPFNWSIKDSNGKVCQSAQQIFDQWLDWQSEMSLELDLGDPLANAVTQMLVRDRGDGTGTGYLRVYSAKIFSNLEPFKQVLFHSPNPNSIEVKRNMQGIAYQADYLFGNNQLETYTLLNNGKTLMDCSGDRTEIDCGGRLPVFEINGKCLLTDAIKQGQNAINKTLTYKGKNLEAAGFLQRFVLNGQPPGEWIENPQTGNTEFIPSQKPIEVGSNITTFISGKPLGDPRNPKGYTNPSITYKDPVPLSTFQDSMRIDCAKIYYQAGLAYLTYSDLGNISGASRQMLRDDFLLRLGVYKRNIESTLNRLFSIVINALAKDYPVLKGCKPIVKLNLSVIPSIEERQENLEDVKAGVMSIPSAIAKNGLDVTSELELISRYAHLVNLFDW